MTPPTDTDTDAKVVEGSDGMLLEIDGQIVPNYDATIVPFEEGDVVTGKVVRIDKDEVLVDIGYKSEGVIPSGELSIRKSVDTSEEVELGEEVDALVLTKEDQDGRLILSKKRARFERAWRRIEAAAESGEPVIGAVIEVVKGGLIIDLGVRGFLPASLVDIRRVPNLDEYLGQNIQCKVIELNRSRNNVVLSRRAVLEEERKEQRQAILERLQPGLIIEGQISNIVDFGAFVDLDGIDGLIHISELSWSHVNHPSEILTIGDTVQVKVLDIDRDRQRISLGLKQTQEDPWQRVVDTYNVGDELEGTVTKVVAFGAFVEILEGVEGLVHISELAQQHVENPREIVQPGDEVKVKILEIDSERRRLSLSIKRVEGQVLPRRPLADADLENVPELGLSEDVFAAQGELDRGRGPEAEAEAEAAAAEEAEVRGGPRGGGRSAEAEAAEPRRPRSRRPPRPRPERRGGGARRGGRGRGGPPRPRPSRSPRPRPRPSRSPRPRPRTPSSRAERAAVRRSDRRHRRRQVGGPGGARAPGRRHAVRRRRRARAVPQSRDPRGRRRPLGRRGRARRRGRPRRRRPARVRRRRPARLARGPAVAARWASGSPSGGPIESTREPAPRALVVEVPLLFEAGLRRRPTTRRSPSSPTTTSGPSAPPPAATRRSTSAPPASSRSRRRRSERRTWSHNSGTLEELEQELSAVLAKLTLVSAHAQARPPAAAAAPRRRVLRRRLLLLGFVVAAAALAMAILSPWADKAVQEISLPLRHDDIIRQQAEDKNLDPSLIAGVIYVESRFRDQTSHAGAKGLMQIMPSTADYIASKSGGTEFEQGDLATPQINIAYGSWYLRYLLEHYHGNTIAGARRLQRRRGQGRRVVARGGRPRRALPRRRPHPVPGDARLRRARCSTPAARTGASTRRSSACELPRAGPHRPAGLGDRLRRLGHRRRRCGSAPRTTSRCARSTARSTSG